MKKTMICVGLALCSLAAALPAAAQTDVDSDADREAVIACVRDYIDGWYEGDAERIANALHPDLMKRTVRSKDGADFLSPVSCAKMIEYTRAGAGKKSALKNQVNEVIVLDMMKKTATAKSISHEFVDYIHLARIDGKWWIVNVLWEWNQ